MRKIKVLLKWSLWTIIFLLVLSIAVFYFYCNSLKKVNPLTVSYYEQLKAELKKQGLNNGLVVMSSKRANWHNHILTFFGAASNSRHLSGDAIDILVLDVNNDQEINGKDVDITYEILDSKIVKNKGGLGIYKSEVGIWNRQMIHLDCRENRTRWSR
jgi:uncharacterized protein YcbK (DUF882 family)